MVGSSIRLTRKSVGSDIRQIIEIMPKTRSANHRNQKNPIALDGSLKRNIMQHRKEICNAEEWRQFVIPPGVETDKTESVGEELHSFGWNFCLKFKVFSLK